MAERRKVSDDELVYTFHLHEDVTFHDGTPSDAEAVRFNLEWITSPDLKSQKARFMLGPYEKTEVMGEHTVRIVLGKPFAPLLDALSQVYPGTTSRIGVSSNKLSMS